MFFLNFKFTVISGLRNLPSTKVPKDRTTVLKHTAVKNRPAMLGFTDRCQKPSGLKLVCMKKNHLLQVKQVCSISSVDHMIKQFLLSVFFGVGGGGGDMTVSLNHRIVLSNGNNCILFAVGRCCSFS